ncbi:MAG: hypothetical protein HGA85_03595 [Nanoarchaeota archaeon]|nr:hypothetical protein [Nanoarchaeota archaeon]
MNTNSYIHILEEAGLTGNEARIYLELLKLGHGSPKELTKITNMHRTSVYGCLQRLQKKGLVSSSSVDDKLSFEAARPTKVLSLIKEREINVKKIIPGLEKLHDAKFYSEYDVKYFKGKQGMKTVFDDILATGEDYCGGGPEQRIEALLKHYFIYYAGERKKKKIHGSLIYYESARGKSYTKSPLLAFRYLDNKYYTDTAHRVYGDKVAIILLEDDPNTILIHNSILADSYRKTFELLWHVAKE